MDPWFIFWLTCFQGTIYVQAGLFPGNFLGAGLFLNYNAVTNFEVDNGLLECIGKYSWGDYSHLHESGEGRVEV